MLLIWFLKLFLLAVLVRVVGVAFHSLGRLYIGNLDIKSFLNGIIGSLSNVSIGSLISALLSMCCGRPEGHNYRQLS
jgi:hypothetical protein